MKQRIINWFKETFNPDINNAYDNFSEMNNQEIKPRIAEDYKSILQAFKKSIHQRAKDKKLTRSFKVDFHLSHDEMWYIEKLQKYTEKTINSNELHNKPFSVEVQIKASAERTPYIPDTAAFLIIFSSDKVQTQEQQ